MAEEIPRLDQYGADDLESAWRTWRTDPTPAANAEILRRMEPTLERASRAAVGDYNPLIRGRARRLALQGLNTYKPGKGARLQSHMYNHMQGLKRVAGQMATGIKVPERLMLDRRALDTAQTELTDRLGREPTDDELADHTGFSARRLSRIRSYNPGMTEGFFANMGEQGEGMNPAVAGPGSDAWLQVVKDELDPLDQKVLEYGMAGMPGHRIAARLRRSPGWVSQRMALIQAKLDAEENPF